jgi:DNA-binding beta-propeller fold protein YncE
LAQIVLSGHLGFAQSDGNGRIYITVADRNQIIRLDAQAIGSAVHRILDRRGPATQTSPVKPGEKALLLDWTPNAKPAPPIEAYPFTFFLGSSCQQPRALAFDSAHSRLFAACTNMKMLVLNADTGQGIAALPIGPGPDAIAFDPNRGLIFSANGGGDGSLTIIQQDVTDTYAVVQTLPTRQHARTLAVNSSSGEVYLTSVIYGAQLNHPPANGAPLKVTPVDGSFQVLVVGN